LERRSGPDRARRPLDPRHGDLRRCEEGEIRFLWISGTNPAVSLPELARIRRILSDDRLFVVCQDIFPTETTAHAHVVLAGATWGETGVFTNADRTVHISDRAVAPPGEARSDLDIFLDFARRMDLRDRDGGPLVHWDDPESAYRAWQRASAGRPCDYTGISYGDLRGGSGIQWGGDRLYVDGAFPWAHPDRSETYGRDLVTGEDLGAERYRELNPEGRAMLRTADRVPEPEPPAADRPLRLDHRPHGVPLPHADQDRPHARAAGRRAATLGGALAGRRARARDRLVEAAALQGGRGVGQPRRPGRRAGAGAGPGGVRPGQPAADRVTVLIGTSGWQYAHWRGRLYPRGLPTRRWLEHYAERFATVEVNATFYRLPRPATVEDWARRTPPDFVVVAKASRYLTHIRRLREPAEPVRRLMGVLEPLGERLGAVLLQLPPDMRRNLDALDDALRRFPGGVRVAVEPRHPSWFDDATRSLLERRGAALCMADRPGWRPPAWRTAAWGYLRLHEGRAAPRPCYGRGALSSWAARLAERFTPDEDVFVFMNNDTEGCAVRDARVLAGRLRAAGLRPTRVPGPAETPVGPPGGPG
jgi:uncharacterized protein YecE (DUF72 family)